ncbi:MAG: SpoIIIAH-like family protein [Clostridiales bacterium]|nr:SpoIIIAH-like family protein [Clostridiales bacterium]
MKNIFKKNQIIITALAIMIVIAGYLSFTNNDKPDNEDSLITSNPDYDVISGIDGDEFAQSTTDIGDTTTDDTTTDDTDGTLNDTDNDADGNMETTEDENDETTPVDVEDDARELGDISDEDILAAANDVTDTGELKVDDIPGEAILASTTLDGSFFISKKLEREQDRARSKADLKELIESSNISEASKKPIIDRMIELTNIAELENNTEIMLETKGFADAMVTMNADKDVNVVINTPSLSDQQLAIIEDVVMSEANVTIDKITINPVVIAE